MCSHDIDESQGRKVRIFDKNSAEIQLDMMLVDTMIISGMGILSFHK